MDRASKFFRARASAIGRFAFITIVVVLVIGAVCLGLVVIDGPGTDAQPYDFEAALRNVLELQHLALSEAKAGEPAFFVSHVGCAAPPVWQHERVLQNFKRMVEVGVEVKLILSLSGTHGEPRAGDWPLQLAKRLTERGIDPSIYHILERELRNHSIVAGSARRPLAYICPREPDDTYPTVYFRVRDRRVCQEWKTYLLEIFYARDGPPSRRE